MTIECLPVGSFVCSYACAVRVAELLTLRVAERQPLFSAKQLSKLRTVFGALPPGGSCRQDALTAGSLPVGSDVSSFFLADELTLDSSLESALLRTQLFPLLRLQLVLLTQRGALLVA